MHAQTVKVAAVKILVVITTYAISYYINGEQ